MKVRAPVVSNAKAHPTEVEEACGATPTARSSKNLLGRTQADKERPLWRRVLNDHVRALPLVPGAPTKVYTSAQTLAASRIHTTLATSGVQAYADSAVFLDPEDPEQIERWAFFQSLSPQLHALDDGLPQNPCGGSTVTGRGNLGLWGPNPAADNLLFRWAPPAYDGAKTVAELQLALVQRKSGAWALPGGMKEPHESFAQAASREAVEEMGLPEAFEWRLTDCVPFAGAVAYDPRNTRNAWMVTAAFMLHPDDARARTHLTHLTPQSTASRKLGEETRDAQWFTLDWRRNLAHGTDKHGEAVALDLLATVLSDPYEDNQYKPWVAELAAPRPGTQALYASHGEAVLSARPFFAQSTIL